MLDTDRPRILIVRLSAIGDTVLSLPVLCALRDRFPQAHLAWFTGHGPAKLLAGHPALDEIIAVERDWLRSPRRFLAVRRQLRELRPDVTIDIQSLTKSALPAWLSGARHRIGYTRGEIDGRELSPWLNNVLIEPQRDHVVDRNLELLVPLGIKNPRVQFALPEHAADAQAVDQWLKRAGLADRYAVINPGAGWASKVWPAERYAAVAAHLGRQHKLKSAVVWAGEQERQWAEQIVAGSQGQAALAPSTSLTELASLERRAALFVGSDTGPLHLAAAVGAPCVGLYGPMPASRCGPYGLFHIALQNARIEGTSRQKRTATNDTMLAITSEEACAACDEVLARTGSRQPKRDAA